MRLTQTLIVLAASAALIFVAPACGDSGDPVDNGGSGGADDAGGSTDGAGGDTAGTSGADGTGGGNGDGTPDPDAGPGGGGEDNDDTSGADESDGGGGTDVCVPDCGDDVCGDDGCGGSCGDCAAGELCDAGACVVNDPCTPNPCLNPPTPTCDGDDALTYGDGECSALDDGTFSCVYPETSTTCTDGDSCINGTCADTSSEYVFGSDNAIVDGIVLDGASDCCFDYSGDGVPDNGVGALLGTLGSFLGDVDVDQSIADAIAEGTIAITLDMKDMESASDDEDVTLNGFFGYVDGDGYLIEPNSFVEGSGNSLPIVSFPNGSIEGGTADLGPTPFAVTIPFGEIVISAELQSARITGDITTDGGSFGIADGKIGGVVPMQQIVDALNTVSSDLCACLGTGGDDILELAAEDKLKCTSALQGATPACVEDVDSALCTAIGDNKGLVCTAIGIIKPDIDTDFSGKADAFSVGLTFTAAATTINGIGEDQASEGGGCGECAGGPMDPINAGGHAFLFSMLVLWMIRRREA